LDDTRAWTLKLMEDLAGDDWSLQPAPGLAHPTWICGHLAVAQNLLVHIRCLGRSVLDDAFSARFPIGGDVPPVASGAYPPIETIRARMDEIHKATLAAVSEMSDALLAEPAFGKDGAIHPHYRDKLGAVTHCTRHEAFHAGQLATIRRLTGKRFLR